MDLSQIDGGKMESGAELRLRHPETGDELEHDGKPMVIKLRGKGSKVFREYQRMKNNERYNAQMLKKSVELFPDDDERCETLAQMTIGWSNIIEDGKELPFSEREAKRLYMRRLWIADQADEFIADESNFFTKPSKGRKNT